MTPIGPRRITYTDHTASGRSLSFIEEFMTRQVAVTYANTHTSSSQTGFQTTMFRHEARDLVKRSVGATDADALLFLGNGATGAAHVLVHFLRIAELAAAAEKALVAAKQQVTKARIRAVLSRKNLYSSGPSSGGPAHDDDQASDASSVGSIHEEALALVDSMATFDLDDGADGPSWAAVKPPVATGATPGSMAGSFSPRRAPGMPRASVHFADETEHEDTDRTMARARAGPDACARPLVLVGPYAHHSSLLPWREAGADVLILPEAPAPLPPGVDLVELDRHLREAKEEGRPVVVGALTAASNITGVLVDTVTPTALLHAHGALSVWDYAAAAPHAPIVVNPATGSVRDAGRAAAYLGGDADGMAEVMLRLQAAGVALPTPDSVSLAKDAAYFSPHKFPGGPGTPGVLVVKKPLLLNPVPAVPGGGTVFFVHRDGTPRYLANIEEREEGGTPNITGSIRCGLVMRLHSAVGPGLIRAREAASVAFAAKRWERHPNIVLLGRREAARCAIISFVVFGRPAGRDGAGLPSGYVFHPHHNDGAPGAPGVPLPAGGPLKGAAFGDDLTGRGSVRLLARGRRVMHWAFVAAVLADLFGIQCRGGCLCAGPYGLRLLSLNEEDACVLEGRLLDLEELMRPGVVRVSIPYHTPAHVVRFIVGAVEFVATHAGDLLPLYAGRPDTGEFTHVSWRHVDRPRKWLHMVSFESGAMEVKDGFHDEAMSLPGDAAVHAGKRAMEEEEAAAVGFPSLAPPASPVAAQRKGQRPKLSREVADAAASIRSSVSAWLLGGVPGLDEAILTEAAHRQAGVVPGRAAPITSAGGVPPAPGALPAGGLDGEARAELEDFATYFAEAAEEVDYGRAALTQRGGVRVGLLGAELEDSLLSDEAKKHRWFAIAGETAEAGPEAEAPAGEAASTAAAAAGEAGAGAVTDGGAGHAAAASSGGAGPGTTADSDSDDDADGGFPTFASDTLGDDVAAEEAARVRQAEADAAADVLRLTGRISLAPLVGSLAGFAPAAARFLDPSPRLLAKVRHTVLKYRMIWPGDRVILGLSGGKDSLSCLHILAAVRKSLPFDFELHCCTVDPQSPGFDPTPLIGYCRALGVPYHLESDDIIGAAGRHMSDKRQSICSFCSRMKRGMLYGACRREGGTVLALAQHMDDLAESLMMSTFHNGLLRTMKAHYRNAEGDVRVIRPLALVREHALRDFARTSSLPVIEDNCPACFAAPTERYRTKQLLRSQEQLYPSIIENIGRSLQPLLKDSSWPELRAEGTARILDVWPDFRHEETLSSSQKRAERRRVAAADRKAAKVAAAGTDTTTASVASAGASLGPLEEDDEDEPFGGTDGDDVDLAADLDGQGDGPILLSPGASASASAVRLGADPTP